MIIYLHHFANHFNLFRYQMFKLLSELLHAVRYHRMFQKISKMLHKNIVRYTLFKLVPKSRTVF